VLPEPVEHRSAGAVAQRVAGELCAGPPREPAEVDHDRRALAPQAGEPRLHVGARERDDEEGLLDREAQGGVHVLEGREVAPVHVLEDEHHGLRAALGVEEVDPGRRASGRP
jgi:hypothetical protein